MKTNGIFNPIGYDLGSPSLSWVIKAPLSSDLLSTKVTISYDPDFKKICFESPATKDISSVDYKPKFTIKPRTRYYWRVTAELTGEKIFSEIAFFESSKMDEKWQAQWITPNFTAKFNANDLPLVRKSFKLKRKPTRATVYITGLGLYEMYVNGQKVDDQLFTPFYNNYDCWLQYQTYDITSQVSRGKNVIGVMLGEGWAKGRWGFFGRPADMSRKTNDRGERINLYVDRYMLIAEIHVFYGDKKEVVFGTDASWRCAKSEVLVTNIYDGEVIDGNIELMNRGWSTRFFKDKGWDRMIVIGKPPNLGQLTARFSPPVVVKHRVYPKQIITAKNGDVIVDMGQNMAGWLEVTTDDVLPPNFEIVLEFGEMLNKGDFFRENLRTAQQEFRYISNGRKRLEKVHPHFTYYGFQYVRVKKWFGQVSLSNFVGLSIYSDLHKTGFLRTSSSDVNKLIENAVWSQRDNFIDVPTDCPQRDERMGWTGDAQAFSGTALFNMDSYPFYRKYCHDIYEFQKSSSEPFIPIVIPFPRTFFGPDIKGRCGWADAGCIIPWRTYVFSGKKQILEEQIESMAMWVDWVTANSELDTDRIHEFITTKQVVNKKASSKERRKDDEFAYLWLGDKDHYGDWLAMDGPTDQEVNPSNVFGGTEISFLCSSFYYYSTTLVVKAAKVLDRKDLEEHYSRLASNILKSIRHEFFTQSGRCAVQTQTAQVISLCFGIAQEDKRKSVFSSLYKLLLNDEKKKDSEFALKIKTGFLGTPHLCQVLSDFGYPQFSYDIFMNTNCPGWLYHVRLGATTTWERWDSVLPNGELNPRSSMNSFNHYWIGSILEWIYSNVCGIAPIEDHPGFEEFNLWPQPSLDDRFLTFAESVYESPMGKIKSAWKIIDSGAKRVRFLFTVPFNSVAHLRIRSAHFSSLKIEDGEAKLAQEGEDIVGDLRSGEYSMTVSMYLNEFKLETKYK